MDAFRERNIIVPSRTEQLWGILCWFMHFLGFNLILSQLPFAFESLHGQYLFDLTNTVCSFVLTLCVFRGFLWQSRTHVGALITTALWGTLAAYGLENLMEYLLLVIGDFLPFRPGNLNQSLVVAFLYHDPLPMAIRVVVFGPIVEELLIRGMIFGPLCRKKPIWGYIASMAAFSLLHVVFVMGDQPVVSTIFSFMQYLPSGLMLGWAYQRSGSIWAPICMHSIMNLISVISIL